MLIEPFEVLGAQLPGARVVDGFRIELLLDPALDLLTAAPPEVIQPEGGLDKFRLLNCHEFKIIQVLRPTGKYSDLLIEEDALHDATVAYLERCKVPETEAVRGRKKK